MGGTVSIDRVADASAPDGRAGDPADLPPEVHAALVALREAVAVLTAVDTAAVDGRGAMAVTAALEAATSRLATAKIRLLPVVEADGLWALGGAQSFPVWVSRAHRVGIATAREQVRLARRLRDHLPITAAAAAAGEVTVDQARLIATLGPTTDQRRQVLTGSETACDEAFLVRHARELTVDETRVMMRQ
jgi:hypothetical protein